MLLTRKRRIQILKFSLIFNLIVQVILTLKKNVSRFGCSYTLDLTAHTCNEKNIGHYLLIIWLLHYLKKTVTLNHLSTPFRVDFWNLLQGVGKYQWHWFKCMYRVYKLYICAQVGRMPYLFQAQNWLSLSHLQKRG